MEVSELLKMSVTAGSRVSRRSQLRSQLWMSYMAR
jgi:hypothetical protein